jgi:hypothetical protein
VIRVRSGQPTTRQRPAFRPPDLEPGSDDGRDGERIAYVLDKWHSQDAALRLRDRQVEENIRMLAGQHWSVFDPVSGAFLDTTQWMTASERRWRQRPVFNRVLPWFILTHARMTENMPIITFLPGPDRIDALLAETLDTIYKPLWRQVGMEAVHDLLMAWLIPGGQAHLQTRVDLTKGELKPWVATAEVPVIHGDGSAILKPDGTPATVTVPNVPHDRQGQPLMIVTPDGPVTLGDPHATPEGALVVDVLSPLECRGQWGNKPWHEKRWHMLRSYLTPEQVYEQWGVDIQPDLVGGGAETAGELRRLLFGSGYFGSASAMLGSEQTDLLATGSDGYCTVTTLWEAPCSQYPDNPDLAPYEETLESPGGRLLIVTPTTVLHDTPRPARFRYTSPLRTFGFVQVPGRPQGTTPQETLNPINRAYNRTWAQRLEHTNLCTNPVQLIDTASGLGDVEITNQPGVGYEVVKRPGVQALEWIAPPPLGEDVYRTQELLLRELMDLGNLQGTEGNLPSPQASGKLVEEMRFNSDRYLGPTMRRAVVEYARLWEDWAVLLPIIWDTGKLIQYGGEDNVARTISVLPEVLSGGKIDVIPDLESMLPEGRGERQARVYRMYLDGMFGVPGTPQAIKQFFDLAHFPHVSRAAKPGGVDRTMAEHILGMILQGAPPDAVPWFPWYDPMVHLEVLEGFMKSPEFLDAKPEVQQVLAMTHARYQQQMAAAQEAALQQAAHEQDVLTPPTEGPGGGKPAPGAKREAKSQESRSRARPDTAANRSQRPAAHPLGLQQPTGV